MMHIIINLKPFNYTFEQVSAVIIKLDSCGLHDFCLQF